MKYILLLLMTIGSLFANIGKITSINGKALALRGGNTVLLQKGSTLEEKDVIKTMPNTRLQIVFNDHTVISLGQKTTFRVDKYAFNRQNKEARFSVSRGIFKSITGKIGHLNHSKYTLKTNNATIGVRGTIYVGRVERNRESIACTSGEIVVHTRRGNVVVKKGEITTFTPYTKPSKPTKYKKQNLQLFKGVVSKSDVKAIDSVKIKKGKVKNMHKMHKNKKMKHYKKMHKNKKSHRINKVKNNIQNISNKVSNVASNMDKITQNFGDFSQENMQETHQDVHESKQDIRNDNSYASLIQRAGKSKLHYVGKVHGNNIVNDNYNKMNLNFDLGAASVKGKVAFRLKYNARYETQTMKWHTKIAGRVNDNGTFAFNTISKHYHGGGKGELTGEHLETASGSIDINKNDIDTNIHTHATFTATKK